jgi:hypothetical protein
MRRAKELRETYGTLIDRNQFNRHKIEVEVTDLAYLLDCADECERLENKAAILLDNLKETSTKIQAFIARKNGQ